MVFSVVVRESELVFNLVWTGGVYRYLRYFVFSLLDRTECGFRFIANNCTPDAVREMQRFAAATDRVVEVVVLDVDRMVPHGTALDPILDGRDDGDGWASLDADAFADDLRNGSQVRMVLDRGEQGPALGSQLVGPVVRDR